MYLKTSIRAGVATKKGLKDFYVNAIVKPDGAVYVKHTDDVVNSSIANEKDFVLWDDPTDDFTLLVNDDFSKTIGQDYIRFSDPLKSAFETFLKAQEGMLYYKVTSVSIQRDGLFIVERKGLLSDWTEYFIMREEVAPGYNPSNRIITTLHRI